MEKINIAFTPDLKFRNEIRIAAGDKPYIRVPTVDEPEPPTVSVSEYMESLNAQSGQAATTSIPALQTQSAGVAQQVEAVPEVLPEKTSTETIQIAETIQTADTPKEDKEKLEALLADGFALATSDGNSLEVAVLCDDEDGLLLVKALGDPDADVFKFDLSHLNRLSKERLADLKVKYGSFPENELNVHPRDTYATLEDGWLRVVLVNKENVALCFILKGTEEGLGKDRYKWIHVDLFRALDRNTREKVIFPKIGPEVLWLDNDQANFAKKRGEERKAREEANKMASEYGYEIPSTIKPWIGFVGRSARKGDDFRKCAVLYPTTHGFGVELAGNDDVLTGETAEITKNELRGMIKEQQPEFEKKNSARLAEIAKNAIKFIGFFPKGYAYSPKLHRGFATYCDIPGTYVGKCILSENLSGIWTVIPVSPDDSWDETVVIEGIPEEALKQRKLIKDTVDAIWAHDRDAMRQLNNNERPSSSSESNTAVPEKPKVRPSNHGRGAPDPDGAVRRRVRYAEIEMQRNKGTFEPRHTPKSKIPKQK